jgi:hypothetical protein
LKDGIPTPTGVNGNALGFRARRGPQYAWRRATRHRAVGNAIWRRTRRRADCKISLVRVSVGPTYGGDARLVGNGGNARLRPDKAVVPRNNFVGRPVHRVDVRLQKEFAFATALPAS